MSRYDLAIGVDNEYAICLTSPSTPEYHRLCYMKKTIHEICDIIASNDKPEYVLIGNIDTDDLHYFFSRDDVCPSEIILSKFIPETSIERIQESIKKFTLFTRDVSPEIFNKIACFLENICISVETVNLHITMYNTDDFYVFLSKVCLPVTITSIEISLTDLRSYDSEYFDHHKIGNLILVENVSIKINCVEVYKKS